MYLTPPCLPLTSSHRPLAAPAMPLHTTFSPHVDPANARPLPAPYTGHLSQNGCPNRSAFRQALRSQLAGCRWLPIACPLPPCPVKKNEPPAPLANCGLASLGPRHGVVSARGGDRSHHNVRPQKWVFALVGGRWARDRFTCAPGTSAQARSGRTQPGVPCTRSPACTRPAQRLPVERGACARPRKGGRARLCPLCMWRTCE